MGVSFGYKNIPVNIGGAPKVPDLVVSVVPLHLARVARNVSDTLRERFGRAFRAGRRGSLVCERQQHEPWRLILLFPPFPLPAFKEELYPEQTRDFKRLSLGGYGGLRYIKSIWVERPHPGDHIPGVHIPPGVAYSRGSIRKRGILRRKWPHEKSIDSQ